MDGIFSYLYAFVDCKEIEPVHPKRNESWIFIGMTDAEAETLILWPPHEKSWLIGKDPEAGRDWGQEEKGMTEDEMAGWHHRLDGHELEWTPGVGDGQGGLACWDSWGSKELDITEWLNWTHYTYMCWERQRKKRGRLNWTENTIHTCVERETKKEEREKGDCTKVLALYSLGRIIQETDWELTL